METENFRKYSMSEFRIFSCISIGEEGCFGKERSSNFETFVICSILRERNLETSNILGRKSNFAKGGKNNDGFEDA